MISQACPACRHITTHSFRYRTNGCDIYRCESCGLGRAETSGFDPRAYYTGGYFSGQCRDGYSDYRAAEPILRREFARSVEFVHRFCRGGKLLDLGCAYGFFLKEAQRYFDGSGIELAEEAAEHCRRSGLNVLSGVADEANMRRVGHVDVITLFDDIEQRNDIHMTDPPHICFVCNARQDVQAGTATMLGCFLRQFNPGAIEIALGFLQKKSIRAAEVEKLSAPAKAVNKFDAARKFPPQDGLGGAIVRIAVAALTGEIAAGVIGAWIETRSFRPSETATLASINIASVRSIAKRVRRDVSTGGACLRDHRSSGWLRSALSTAGAPVPTTENPVWSKYWSEAPISSIEKLVCVDHCPGSSSENRPIAQRRST